MLNHPIKASRSPIAVWGDRNNLARFPEKMKHTWNLLVELKGISATFLFCALMLITSPRMTSENFSRAVSEASPTTTLCGHKGRKHFTFTFPQFHGMLHTSAWNLHGRSPIFTSTRNLHFYVQVILEKIEFEDVCFALGVRTEPQQSRFGVILRALQVSWGTNPN